MSNRNNRRKDNNQKNPHCNSQTGKPASSKDSGNGRKSKERELPMGNSMNDLRWYTRYPELVEAVGKVPFPFKPGMLFSAFTEGTENSSLSRQFYIPGVLVLNWAPTVGYSQTNTDPASIVAKEIYSKVRSKFSGSLDADPPDFVIYMMALSSVFDYIGMLKRVFRALFNYNPDNYIVPEGLLAALGCSDAAIQELQQNKEGLWRTINELIRMSRKFKCPAGMDIFQRHYWMSDHVYTDAATKSSQLYVFRQVKFLQFSLLNTPQGVQAGGLSSVNTPLTNALESNVLTTLYNFGVGLIQSLAAWEDSYIISGYLERAYEGVPSFEVALLDYNEELQLDYQAEVLMQIENSRCVPFALAVTALDLNVTQDPTTNSILSRPSVTWSEGFDPYVGGLSPTLSIRSDAPTVGDVLVASRLTNAIINVVTSEKQSTADIICGTEVFHSMYMVTKVVGASSLSQYQTIDVPMDTFIDTTTMVTAAQPLISLAALFWLNQWDWHPMPRFGMRTAGSAPSYFVYDGDIHNITTITFDQLAQIHRQCLFSEFDAFTFGS